MNLDVESRQLLLDSASEWFAESSPVSVFRSQRDTGEPVTGVDLWPTMAELGWSGLMIPEAFGGSGLGLGEMAILLEQAGRNLSASPLLSTAVIGASALLLAEQSAYTEHALKRIAAGDLRLAVATDERHHHDPDTVESTARREGEGWVLSGRKLCVADAACADAYLVSAHIAGNDRIGLFLLPASAEVKVTPLALIDSRDHGEVVFEDARAEPSALLESMGEANALLERVLDRARIGMAAEMLGCARGAFDLTLEYLKIREQFGQLIGSFQALQHRAAGMYVELELARSVLDAALAAVDSDSPDVPALASKAKALVGDTLHRISNEAIQLHGGIGMTDEHDAGLYRKRARVMEHSFGTAAYHRERFARIRGF